MQMLCCDCFLILNVVDGCAGRMRVGRCCNKMLFSLHEHAVGKCEAEIDMLDTNACLQR